jgi:hypothetical protein
LWFGKTCAKTNTSSAQQTGKVNSNYLTVIPLNKITGMKISLRQRSGKDHHCIKMLLDQMDCICRLARLIMKISMKKF